MDWMPIEQLLSSRLAPGERILLTTRLHWGILVAPLLTGMGMASWGTDESTLFLIASAFALVRALAFKGESLMAVTNRRFIAFSAMPGGKPSSLNLQWR